MCARCTARYYSRLADKRDDVKNSFVRELVGLLGAGWHGKSKREGAGGGGGGLVSMPVMCSSSSRPSCEIRVEAGTAATRRDSTPRPFVYPYGVALAAAVARASSFVSLARSGPVRPMRVLCSCKSSADHKLKTEELPVRLPPSVCLPSPPSVFFSNRLFLF